MRPINMMIAAAVLALPVAAQAEYPEGPVTIVVPFGAGGSTDSTARFVAEGLEERWGVPVIVENKPGAGTAIGVDDVAHADPDGQRLLVITPSLTTKAVLDTTLSYDPATDIESVAMLAQGPFVLVAGPKTSATTIAELQEVEDDIFYAAAGVGSSTHFVAAQLNSLIGIDAEPVFYNSGTEIAVDVIGGRIDIYLGTVSQLLGNIQAGQMKALAVTSAERDPALPDVPTMVEAGVPDAVIEQWWGLFAPGETPAEIVGKINADVNAILATDKAKAFFAALGGRPVTESAAFMEATVQSDLDKWAKVAAEHGIEEE